MIGQMRQSQFCHTGTRDLAYHTKRAEILIAAMGKAGIITADMVDNNAVVIDVGTNRVPDAESKNRISSCRRCGFCIGIEKGSSNITCSRGVGPMTIVMLLKNTIQAAKLISTRQ